jgi:hypothetical protein
MMALASAGATRRSVVMVSRGIASLKACSITPRYFDSGAAYGQKPQVVIMTKNLFR